mmetsp:Transcript_17974/g.23330  ORF Transcript_17974/g.23330 Transcript_17974/m.23330 type:complete len:127 (+) Transcript_17974:240-620(+)
MLTEFNESLVLGYVNITSLRKTIQRVYGISVEGIARTFFHHQGWPTQEEAKALLSQPNENILSLGGNMKLANITEIYQEINKLHPVTIESCASDFFGRFNKWPTEHEANVILSQLNTCRKLLAASK